MVVFQTAVLIVRMAINNGSPVQLEHGDTMAGAREFLKHPLSTELDGRLVAACELLDARCMSLAMSFLT